MAGFSLRRYDHQAVASVVMSGAAVLSALALALLVFRNVDTTDFVIYYGRTRRLLVLIAGAATMLLGAAGFGLGLNSAGQRRNDRQQMSWLGFFTGAAVLCIAVVLMFIFMSRGEQVIVQSAR